MVFFHCQVLVLLVKLTLRIIFEATVNEFNFFILELFVAGCLELNSQLHDSVFCPISFNLAEPLINSGRVLRCGLSWIFFLYAG